MAYLSPETDDDACKQAVVTGVLNYVLTLIKSSLTRLSFFIHNLADILTPFFL
jgi:hypothetical protein